MTDVRGFLVGLFREAYEGAWRGTETYFVDNRPGAGLLDTLGLLTAAEASHVVVPGTSTIVGHVVHLTIGMAATREELDGGHPQVDWEATWTRQSMDDAAWKAAQENLREEYEGLRSRFEDKAWGSPLMEALAYSTAHAAWHLGAVRQLMGERVARQG